MTSSIHRRGYSIFVLCAIALCAGCGGSASMTEAAPGSPGAGGGSTAGLCSGDSITFKLAIAPGNSTNYCVATTSYTCGLGDWLSIRNTDGTYLPQQTGSCTGSCDPCAQIACSNICLEPERIGSDGVTATFDGSYFVSKTCGSGTSCADSTCAPPGNYVASLCGAVDTVASPPGAACTSVGFGSPQTCVDVPFTWPPATSGTVLQATLSADSGS